MCYTTMLIHDVIEIRLLTLIHRSNNSRITPRVALKNLLLTRGDLRNTGELLAQEESRFTHTGSDPI